MMKLWAVVPVKALSGAKQRLAPLLAAHERAALACAMLDDVLHALVASRCLAGVLVVTNDDAAAARARRAGAGVLADAPDAGLAAAVRHAASVLAAEHHGGMLVVPADLPAICAADVELIALGHRAMPAVTLVAASADGGTNALACTPANALPICFGADSFRRHFGAALALGLQPRVLKLPRLACDIDRPADLLAFVQRPTPTRTYALLAASGIAPRARLAAMEGTVCS